MSVEPCVSTHGLRPVATVSSLVHSQGVLVIVHDCVEVGEGGVGQWGGGGGEQG